MRTIDEILDKILELEGLKNDAALAKCLKVKPNTVSTWRKRQTLPYEVLIQYCDDRKYDIGWLITGKITARYVEIDGQMVLTTATEPGLYAQDDRFQEIKRQCINVPPGRAQSAMTPPAPILDAFIEVMTSDDEETRLALEQNTVTFVRTVRNEKKLKELETIVASDKEEIAQLKADMEAIKRRLFDNVREDDFKVQESQRGKGAERRGKN